MGRPVAGKFVSDFPRQAVLYDTEANELPVDRVRAGSNKKFHWRCPEGPDHVWVGQPNTLCARDQGCPFCAGKRPSVTNRLDVLHPELVSEWSPENELPPSAYVDGSEKKAHWVCSKNPAHTWAANIANRTRLGAGCPKCQAEQTSARMSIPDPGRSIADIRPDLVPEWSPRNERTPDQVAAMSNEFAWWQCDQGHEWDAKPATRTGKNTGCPYCSGRRVTPETALATRPDLVAQFDWAANAPLTPNDLTVYSGKVVHWVCDQGHRWTAKAANRASLGRGCPYCTGQKVGYGNDLETRFPDIAAQWHPTLNGDRLPSQVMPGTHKKAWWLCDKNPDHVWEASINARHGSGCPECAAGSQRSKYEVAIQIETAARLGVETVGHRYIEAGGELLQADVIIPEWKVVVEYDGAHWHNGKHEHDREKTQRLKDTGWTVIRVREAPLVPVGEWDRVVAKKHSVVTAVCAAFDGLAAALANDRRGVHVAEQARDLRTHKRLVSQAELDGLLAGIWPPPDPHRPRVAALPKPGRSLQEVAPVVAAEWDAEANGKTAAQVAVTSNVPAHWTCSLCGEPYEQAPNQRTGHGRETIPGCGPCRRKNVWRTRRARVVPRDPSPQALTEALVDEGWTVQSIAEAAGVADNSVRGWLKGGGIQRDDLYERLKSL